MESRLVLGVCMGRGGWEWEDFDGQRRPVGHIAV